MLPLNCSHELCHLPRGGFVRLCSASRSLCARSTCEGKKIDETQYATRTRNGGGAGQLDLAEVHVLQFVRGEHIGELVDPTDVGG